MIARVKVIHILNITGKLSTYKVYTVSSCMRVPFPHTLANMGIIDLFTFFFKWKSGISLFSLQFPDA